ncbi:extracellular solute-binding protein [Paenibacillus sp. GCM10027626]|uniref:extracellular solute-binding protein n=1 Tax=Paenibacillus sp. GCM10027626 TaxID=3273411 RepID=UPI003644F9E2
MKALKKRMLLAAAAMTMVSSLAACSGNTGKGAAPAENSGNGPNSTADNSGSADQRAETAPFKEGKYDPPIPINIAVDVGDDIQYFNGETAEKNILFDRAKENLGLDIHVLWTAPGKNDGFKTKLLLSLSSGEKLPDVVYTGGDFELTNQLIDSGMFMDLNEAIDKYASDDIKRIYAENPDLFLPVTRDGKTMALPIPIFGPNSPPLMYIRQDWLDKLNLKPPTTMEELEKVMDAFVNQDPDGNNKKDTYALAVQLKNPGGDIFADATALFGAYGAIPGIWRKSSDGNTLTYDSIQPEMKTALGKFKEWLDKGYISKDAAQQDGGTAAQLFTSGKAGIVFGPNWFPYFPLPELEKNVPGATYKVYPLPTGPSGKAERRAMSIYGGALLINKDYPHPDAVFKYAQAMYEMSRDGQIWGLTRDYLINNGYQAQGSYFQVSKYGFLPNYFVDPWYQIDGYLDYMKAGKPGRTESEQEGFDSCQQNPLCIDGQIEAMSTWRAQKDADVINAFAGPATETQSSQGDFLYKLEYETMVKIIYGSMPLDDFDQFVEKWKTSGGEKVIQEVNDWYQQNVLKK